VLRQKPVKLVADYARAFSSEVDTGSRQENASGIWSPVLIQIRTKRRQQQAERRPAMSSSDQDRQRNRKIAENEADRQMIGDVRVSVWAIVVTIIAGVIAVGIVWAWLDR
jgi:Flp pilus assembly protein TadB